MQYAQQSHCSKVYHIKDIFSTYTFRYLKFDFSEVKWCFST